MTKKKPEPAAAATPDPQGEAIKDLLETRSETDKAAGVLKELKDRSAAWRVREMFKNPFPIKSVKFKPQMVKNNRCLAMPYIDARLVQDRLDETVDVDGWRDDYTVLPDGSVLCRLSVKIGEWWVTKCDVGSPSEQPDVGDRLKAAFSDALKRTAVKFGIGRYLYRFPAQWVDYDPVKKQFTQMPGFPEFARPKANPAEWALYHGEGEFEESAAESKPEPAAETKPPSNGTPPQKELSEDQKAAKIEELKKFWTVKMCECHSPEDLTKLVKGDGDIKHVPAFAKAALWAHISGEAKSIGWLWRAGPDEFYAAAQKNPAQTF